MSKPQIFNHTDFAETQKSEMEDEQKILIRVIHKDGKPWSVVIDGVEFDRFQLLAFASLLSSKSKDLARWVLNIASRLFHWQEDWAFNELYGTVAMDITRHWIETEASLYTRFEEKAPEILGGDAKIVRVKVKPKHRPDSWVRMNGNNIPVEIKLGKFDAKALKQLQRYMSVYESSLGIAVGERATVDLPENVIFISTKELK